MATKDWRPVCLGNLVEIQHGYAFEGEFFTEEPGRDILLTPGNFDIGGGFKSDKFKYYTGPVPEEYALATGDLIVTMTDLSKESDTLGYPAIIPFTSDKRYLHNQRLGKVIIQDETKLDKRFLYYRLRALDYRHEVLASATGSVIRHTSPNRIKAFEFLMPPLATQRAIAAILGSLDDKIELNRGMNETLEAITHALFKSWFVDFDPVHAKATGRRPVGMDAETAALFPDAFEDSSLGEVPMGWQVKPLDEIANYLNGLALQKYPPEGDEFLPVVKIAQLRKNDTGGADKASALLDPTYVVTDGDILFSWSGSLEVVVWCGGKGALNQHLFKVTSAEYPKWFYYQWTKHHLPDFQQIASGKATTMGHIQRQHLSAALTVVAPPDVMKAADSIIAPLLNRMIVNNVETRTLATLRDALLPKLLSGEVRVKDVAL